MNGLEYLKTLSDDRLEALYLRRKWLKSRETIQDTLCPDMIEGIKSQKCSMINIKCADCVEAWLSREVEYEEST